MLNIKDLILESYKNNDYHNALFLINNALESEPYNIELYKIKGNIFIKKKLYREAINAFESIPTQNQDSNLLITIIKLYLILKEKNKIIELIEVNSKLWNKEENLIEIIKILRQIKLTCKLDKLIPKINYKSISNIEIINLLILIKSSEKDFDCLITLMDRLIEIEPNNPRNIINKALLFRRIEKYEEAIKLLESENDPNIKYILSMMHLNPINIFNDQKNSKLKCNLYINELENNDLNSDFTSLIQPFYLAYIGGNHVNLMSKIGTLISKYSKKNSIKFKNKIRLGIVSKYFYKHSVWDAIIYGYLERIDRNIFELYVYNINDTTDSCLDKYINLKTISYFNNTNTSNITLQINNDQIDILLFPEIGMDPSTHKIALSRNATTQVVSWGHPLTSGLPNIDYYISCDFFEFGETQNQYTEKLLNLPNIGSYYKKIEELNNSISNIEKISNKNILIPCNLIKINKNFIYAIIKIANENMDFNFYVFESSSVKLNLIIFDYFKSINNIHCERWKNHQEYLDMLKNSTLILDSFDFSGFNTLMQAINFEIPFVSMQNYYMRANFGVGILKALNLDELIANNVDDYINIVNIYLKDYKFREKAVGKLIKNKNLLFENSEFDKINSLLKEIYFNENDQE